MKKLLVALMLSMFLISFASARVDWNNPNILYYFDFNSSSGGSFPNLAYGTGGLGVLGSSISEGKIESGVYMDSTDYPNFDFSTPSQVTPDNKTILFWGKQGWGISNHDFQNVKTTWNRRWDYVSANESGNLTIYSYNRDGASSSGAYSYKHLVTNFSYDDWNMIAIVVDDVDSRNVSVNGINFDDSDWIGTTSGSSLYSSFGGSITLHIYDINGNNQYAPNGYIDELAIVNESFSLSQILDYYNNGDGIPFGEIFPNSPVLNFPDDSSIDVGTSVLLNATISDNDGDNLDVYFINASDNSTICFNESVANSSDVLCSWDNLEELTTYNWYVIVDDGFASNQSEIRSFTTGDFTAPQIEYSTCTAVNNSVFYSISIIYVNVSAYDISEDTIIFYLLDSEGTPIDSTESTTGEREITWIVSDGTYQYYVYSNDTYGNENQTETRTITIYNHAEEFYPLFTGEITYEGENFEVYKTLRSAGAGLGKFFVYIAVPLGILLLIVLVIFMVVEIGTSIASALRPEKITP